jgi:translation elongation factor EF-Ts
MTLKRAVLWGSTNGVYGSYVHTNGSYGCIVELSARDSSVSDAHVAAVQDFASKLAQQIVSQDPGHANIDALMAQRFVFQPAHTVSQLTANFSKSINTKIFISRFLRWKSGTEQ